jgi:hypothetical protein
VVQLVTPKAVSAAMAAWIMACRICFQVIFFESFIGIFVLKDLFFSVIPDSTPKVAVRHLMRWIARCAPLLHALEATGYHPCQKSFTCRQLQLVYLHLGEP